jgi:hypothetical protein
MNVIKRLLILLIALFPILSVAQVLERRITYKCQSQTIANALRQLEQQENIVFSYSPSIIDGQKMVSINAVNTPLRGTLLELIGSTYNFKESKNYIIITRDSKASKYTAIKGYVEDSNGHSVDGATVYHQGSRRSANTNAAGYYQLYIERDLDPMSLQVGKANLADTALKQLQSNSNYEPLTLRAQSDTTLYTYLSGVKRGINDVSQDIASFWIKNRIEVQNVDDTIYRAAQVSFVPFIGTNRKLSANCSNAFSFNILGGYAFSSRAFEFAGLFNMNRENATGFQLAGLYNINGGTQHGAQISGLFGYNQRASCGFQLGGLFNINPGGFTGMNIAGLVHYSGFNSSGFTLSGVGNVQRGDYKGVQLAGVFNVAHSATVQIGTFNVAKHAKTQIGVINIADSVSGVPIGVFSLIKKGYHKVEISYDSDKYLNGALRLGVSKLYTIYFAGMKPSAPDSTEWTFGFGFGTSPKVSYRTRLNFDLTTQQMIQGGFAEYYNIRTQFQVGVESQIFKHLALFAAVNVSYLTADSRDPYDAFESPLYRINENPTDWWIGARAGVRLF